MSVEWVREVSSSQEGRTRLCWGRERLTLLRVDLGPDVQVDAHDDQVAEQVQTAAGVEHIGVFEGDPLGHLHHTQDDDDVGSACDGIMSVLCQGNGLRGRSKLAEAVACDDARDAGCCWDSHLGT